MDAIWFGPSVVVDCAKNAIDDYWWLHHNLLYYSYYSYYIIMHIIIIGHGQWKLLTAANNPQAILAEWPPSRNSGFDAPRKLEFADQNADFTHHVLWNDQFWAELLVIQSRVGSHQIDIKVLDAHPPLKTPQCQCWLVFVVWFFMTCVCVVYYCVYAGKR